MSVVTCFGIGLVFLAGYNLAKTDKCKSIAGLMVHLAYVSIEFSVGLYCMGIIHG